MLRTIIRRAFIQPSFPRAIHTSAVTKLREIYVEKKDKTTIVGAKYVESDRKSNLLKLNPNDEKCPLCQLQLPLKHTDVLILCQYIDSVGNIIPRNATKLCADQYKLVKELIYMAQHAGLLPEPPRDEPKRPFEKLNTYYDETTITVKPVKKKFERKLRHLKLGPIEKLRIKPEVGHYFGRRY